MDEAITPEPPADLDHVGAIRPNGHAWSASFFDALEGRLAEAAETELTRP